MRKSIKRLISAVLLNVMILSIILPCITVPVEAADAKPYYWLAKGLPNSVFEPIITPQMWNSTPYKNQLLKTDWGSNLVATANCNSSYNLNYGNYRSRLRYTHQYWHDKDEKTPWYANFKWDLSPYTKQLIANQELKMYLEARLAADNHNNFIHHRGEMRNDRAQIEVTCGRTKGSNLFLGGIMNSGTDADEVFYTHSEEFKLPECDYVNFTLGGNACGCGSSKVKNTIIALVDEKSPTVKEAKICDEYGNPLNHISSGKKGRVAIVFSEPMRFADHDPKPYTINLDLYDRALEQSIATKLEATLVSLDKDTLYFEFEVPDKIGDEDTDVYIKSVSKDQPDTIFAGSGAPFDLVSIAKYDRGKTIHVNSLELSGGVGIENINKAKSAITDLAGNSVTWDKAVPVNKAFLDGLDPKVESIELKLIDNKVPTYAGVGSKIVVTMFFSEKMKFLEDSHGDSKDNIKVTLNLRNNDVPIVLDFKEAYEVKNSVNRPAVTAVEFWPCEINSNLSLQTGDEKVKIAKIMLDRGVTDLSDNPVDKAERDDNSSDYYLLFINGDDIPIPDQEIRLDVTPPVVGEENSAIVGTATDDGFTYLFDIADSGSEVTGKKGKFAWVDKSEYKDFEFNNVGKTFLYALSSDVNAPEEEYFKTGIISAGDNIYYEEFNQIEGNNYLHIKIEDASDILMLESELHIIAVDRLENESEVKVLEIKEKFLSDKTPPTVEMGKHYFTIDGTDIELHVPVVVRDKSGVKEIYYKWKNEVDFSNVGLINNQNEVYESQSLTISKTVSQAVYGTDSLTVYAVDIADNSGENVEVYVCDDALEDENMLPGDKYHQKRNYNYNTVAPVSDLGPNQRDPKDLNIIGPSLFIDRPKKTGIYNEATTAIIVRNPYAEFKNNIWEHFVYFLDSDGASLKEDDEYVDFFDKYRNMSEADWANNTNLTGWYTGNFLKYEKFFHTKPLSECVFDTSEDEPKTSKEQFAAIFGRINLDKSRWHHYGDLEIRVITVAKKINVDSIIWWNWEEETVGLTVHQILEKDGIGLNEDFPNKTYIKMRSADPLGIDEEDDPDSIYRLYDGYSFLLDDYEELETHKILKTEDKPEGEKAYWFRPDIHGTDGDYNKKSDLNEKPVTVSLEEANGLKIPFAFNDGHVIFDYDDIDETKSNLKLYYTGDQASGIDFEATEENLVYTAPIYAKYWTQYFTLSVNQENVNKFKTGYYALVASMATKSKGINNKHFTRQDLLVSDLFIDTYAPAKDDFILSLQGFYGDKNREITTSATGQLVGSVGSGMDWKINIEQKGTESQLTRNNKTYYSYPNSEDYKIDMDGMYWIKVWNPDVEDSEENAKWQYYTKDYKLTFIDKTKKDGDEGYEYGDYEAYKDGVAYAPVVNGEKNIMQYQFCSYNGVPGSIGQFTLLVGDEANRPSFKIWCSHEEDTPAKSVVIGPTDIKADNFIEGYGLLIEKGGIWESVKEAEALLFTYEEIDENDDTVEIETMNYEIFKNGNYKYYIYDDYGMTGEEEIVINNIDTTEPTIAVSDVDFENRILKFTATVTDDYPLDGGSLLVKFGGGLAQDSHLEKLDKVDETENSDVYISIPLDSEKIAKEAYRKAGIYKLTVEDDNGDKEKTVKIEMIIGDVPENSDSVVYLDAIDIVGNKLDAQSFTVVKNFDEVYEYAPAIVNAYWNIGESMVYLKFNTLVKLLSHNLADSDYGISVPTTISANGIYTIEYTDIFGDTYSEYLEIDLNELDLGLDIQYDKTLTNKDIKLTLKTSDDVYITKTKIGENTEITQPADTQVINNMIITENCIVYVTIKKGLITRTQAISIDNIDKTINSTSLHWIFEGDKDEDNKTTNGFVTVAVVGDEPLVGDLTYTFTNGAKIGDKHTFSYSDEAGNEGEITATLEYNIVFSIDDKLAPGVEIKVYFKTFEAYNQGLSGSAGNFNLSNIDEEPPEGIEDSPTNYSEETGSPIDWNNEDDINIRSQAVRMDLKITDQSATKVFIKSTNSPPQYSDAASNKVDKAELIGNSIFIDTTGETDITPQDFYIFVVDEKDNWTSFLVKPGLLDKTAPEIEDISVKLHDPYRAEAILKIAKKDAKDTTVTNRTGIVKYDDSTYGYMTGSNEIVTFYYHDSVGNSDERSIQTAGLDEYAPELIGLTWSPQGTGAGDIQSPPEGPIKGSLLAQLTIKNQLSKVVLENNENKDVKLSFTDKKINLIFNENAEVTLKITSPNGEMLEYPLDVSCLDNEKLVIERTKTEIASNKRSAKLTFTPNKYAYFVEGKQWKDENESFDEYTLASTKPIELNFTDKVGNVYKEKIDLSGILDFSPLKLQFNTTNNDIDAVDKLSDLFKDSTGENLSIYVKSSHKVTVEGATNKNKIDTVDIWTELTLKKVDNKAILKFTDERGDSFSTAAYFKIPDEVPPVILLKETVISVAKDIATVDTLKDLIGNAIMVSDNVSKVDDIEVTINIDNVNLKVLGIYTATITAKDEAGKISIKDIQIRVAPAEGLLAQIGSRFLEPNGTHILYGDSLKFSLMTQVRKLVEEPYKIYIKEELQTPGQMKSAERFFSDDDNSEQEIKFESTGLHTIYIQTQNRYNYIFYVYVMD